MPRDVQGVLRGKCNGDCCDCEEYYPPPEGKGLKCEYCDHVPVLHVRIIALGACRGCSDCDKYLPEKETSYSECQYCGCDASQHKGAESLRKTPAPQAQVPPPTAPTDPHASFQPRVSPRGQPMQTAVHGLCSFPGCPYPRRVEDDGSRVHDFCSRTCARKASQMLTGGPPPTTVVRPGYAVPPGGGMHALVQQQPRPPPPTGKSQPTVVMIAMTKPAAPGDKTHIPSSVSANPSISTVPMVASNAAPLPSRTTVPLPLNTCKNCGIHAANPGRSWCQACYTSKT